MFVVVSPPHNFTSIIAKATWSALLEEVISQEPTADGQSAMASLLFTRTATVWPHQHNEMALLVLFLVWRVISRRQQTIMARLSDLKTRFGQEHKNSSSHYIQEGHFMDRCTTQLLWYDDMQDEDHYSATIQDIAEQTWLRNDFRSLLSIKRIAINMPVVSFLFIHITKMLKNALFDKILPPKRYSNFRTFQKLFLSECVVVFLRITWKKWQGALSM